MSYTISIQPEAESEFQEAYQWYEATSPGLGEEFLRAVDVCLSAIERNPLS